MKNNSKERPYDRFMAASHAATDWVSRLRSGESDPTDEESLNRWLRADPEHQEAFDRANAIWDRSGDLKSHPLVVAEQVKLPEQGPSGSSRGWGWLGGMLPTTPLVRPLAAAVAIVLVSLTVWVSQRDSLAPRIPAAEYRTKIGAQESVLLADGSTALLDTATIISADFSSDIRRVTLSKGRALFSVVRDPDKPFIVTARGTEVRVLGTEFSVAMQDGKIAVAVLRGRVRFLPGPDLPSSRSLTVGSRPDGGRSIEAVQEETSLPPGGTVDSRSASLESRKGSVGQIVRLGQEAIFDEKRSILEIQPANLRRISAWRSGRLDFDRAPLADVVDEINRYLDRKIRIADEDLSSVRISMVFKISDCDHFLSALGNVVPIVSSTSPDGDIRLTRGSNVGLSPPDRNAVLNP